MRRFTISTKFWRRPLGSPSSALSPVQSVCIRIWITYGELYYGTSHIFTSHVIATGKNNSELWSNTDLAARFQSWCWAGSGTRISRGKRLEKSEYDRHRKWKWWKAWFMDHRWIKRWRLLADWSPVPASCQNAVLLEFYSIMRQNVLKINEILTSDVALNAWSPTFLQVQIRSKFKGSALSQQKWRKKWGPFFWKLHVYHFEVEDQHTSTFAQFHL